MMTTKMRRDDKKFARCWVERYGDGPGISFNRCHFRQRLRYDCHYLQGSVDDTFSDAGRGSGLLGRASVLCIICCATMSGSACASFTIALSTSSYLIPSVPK